jgi:hypothetical protein
MKPYCTQNNGHCFTCSLHNYNRDCQNIPLRGGPRENAGRPPTGRKQRKYYLTDAEHEQVKEFSEKIKGGE